VVDLVMVCALPLPSSNGFLLLRPSETNKINGYLVSWENKHPIIILGLATPALSSFSDFATNHCKNARKKSIKVRNKILEREVGESAKSRRRKALLYSVRLSCLSIL